jgi:hypothetical protein
VSARGPSLLSAATRHPPNFATVGHLNAIFGIKTRRPASFRLVIRDAREENRVMKYVPLMVFVACVLGAGCSSSTGNRKAVLVSDVPWLVGEAKVCRYDGKYNEGHCWPAQKSAEPGVEFHRYWVTVHFDGQVRFNKDQWADLDCRLDSFTSATCRQ